MPSVFDSIMELKRPDTSESSNVSPLRETYRGIPTNDKSKMWDYSLEEGEDGKRILSFLVDDSVINFKLNQPKDKESTISATRLPDADRADFGARGNATKGRFQVHKSGPNSLYGTIHGGKKTMTFGLDNPDASNHDWTVTAKNAPITDVANLVKSVSIKDKTAFQMPTMDQLTSPLTGSYPVAMGLSALLGAGGMATYHIGRKVLKRIKGEDTSDDRPLWQDMLLGAGGGALASGAFKAFGEADHGLGRKAPSMNSHLMPWEPLNFKIPDELKPAGVVYTSNVRNAVQPKIAEDKEAVHWSHDITRDIMGGRHYGADYLHGEAKELGEAIKERDLGHIKEELGDTAYAAQMIASQKTGLNLPVVGADAVIKKFYDRIGVWKNLFKERDIPFSVDYLKGGSNYAKPDKIQKAFALAGHQIDDKDLIELANKNDIKFEYQPHEIKQASMDKRAGQVDLAHIQNLLSYDQSLTGADRRILISQLEQASRMSQGGDIDMNRVRNAGLGMLFGYVTAKLLGFGLPGQIGTAALGGFVGSNSTQSGGKQWDSRGFYHY